MTAPINLNSDAKYPVDSAYPVATEAKSEGAASSGVSVRSSDRVKFSTQTVE